MEETEDSRKPVCADYENEKNLEKRFWILESKFLQIIFVENDYT